MTADNNVITTTALRGRLMRSILYLFSSNYFKFLLSFIVQLILVRLLAPNEFGLYALALAFVEIVLLFSSLSSRAAALNFQEIDDSLMTIYIMSWLTWGGYFLLLLPVVIISQYYDFYKHLILIFFLVTLCKQIVIISSIRGVCLEKGFYYKFLSGTLVVVSILSSTVAIVLAMQGFGIWSLIAREFIEAIVSYVLIRLRTRRMLEGHWNYSIIKLLMHYGIKVFITRLADVFINKTPSIFIGYFAGLRINGFLDRVNYLVNIIPVLINPIVNQISQSVYSKYQNDITTSSFTANWHFFICVRIGFILCPLCYFYSTEICLLILGKNWLDAAPYLKAFSLWVGVIPLVSGVNYYLMSSNKVDVIYQSNILPIGLLILAMYLSWKTSEWVYIPWFISIGQVLRVVYYVHRLRTWLDIDFKDVFIKPLFALLTVVMVFNYQLTFLYALIFITIFWLCYFTLIEFKKIKLLLSYFNFK